MNKFKRKLQHIYDNDYWMQSIVKDLKKFFYKKSRTLVISDIHGGYKALVQVLQKANVNYKHDKLIVIGDICDGWPEVKESFEEVLKFKNLVYILGNHDDWALEYYKGNKMSDMWYYQGGHATLESFGDKMPDNIYKLLKNSHEYYIKNNILFVHGGFDPKKDIDIQEKQKLIWDRKLFDKALHKQVMNKKHGHTAKLSKYDKVFIGHTPTLYYNKSLPMQACEVHLIDTGASYIGPLTLIDVNTEEIWQSDPVHTFYPGIKARGHIKD